MNRMTVEMSIDVALSDEEYDSFELFCNQLNIDYDEGFKKLIQILLMHSSLAIDYLDSEPDTFEGKDSFKERLTGVEKVINCLVQVDELLQEKIAKIEDTIDKLPKSCDISYLEQSIDELAENLDNLSME